MRQAPPERLAIRYEGPGAGTELWGMTQANFSLAHDGGHAREVAVQVNDAALSYIASQVGEENSEEFRGLAAQLIGERWLRGVVGAGERPSPLTTVSRHTLEQHPEILDGLKASFAGPGVA